MSELPTRLTLENHGTRSPDAFYTVDEFWDCDCDEDSIRPKSEPHCQKCNCTADDSPDSRLHDVLDRFPELVKVPWTCHVGQFREDRNHVIHNMIEYICHNTKKDLERRYDLVTY